jgi:hypothetical protein
MTMATINLLMGIDASIFTLGVALGALVYVREGLRTQGGLRRWNFLRVAVLSVIAWASALTVGQDFAQAHNPVLLAEPADVVSLIAVAVYALAAIAILTAGAIYWRRALRSLIAA